MNKSVIVKLAAAASVLALAGCSDMKQHWADIETLKSSVAKLQGESDANKGAADNAAKAAAAAQSTANQASSAASAAQSTANQAASAAQSCQSTCQATDEKIDRMFKHSVSK